MSNHFQNSGFSSVGARARTHCQFSPTSRALLALSSTIFDGLAALSVVALVACACIAMGA